MANSSRKVKKAELERQEQTEREIIGICFIALALSWLLEYIQIW